MKVVTADATNDLIFSTEVDTDVNAFNSRNQTNSQAFVKDGKNTAMTENRVLSTKMSE